MAPSSELDRSTCVVEEEEQRVDVQSYHVGCLELMAQIPDDLVHRRYSTAHPLRSALAQFGTDVGAKEFCRTRRTGLQMDGAGLLLNH